MTYSKEKGEELQPFSAPGDLWANSNGAWQVFDIKWNSAEMTL
jgi:hypothetical protein